MTEIEIAMAALQKIANPIAFLVQQAEADGSRLNGAAACVLADDPQWLRSQAQDALMQIDGLRRAQEQQKFQDAHVGGGALSRKQPEMSEHAPYKQLKGKTFGIQFIELADVQDGDKLLIVDATLRWEPGLSAPFMKTAALGVVTGAQFTKNVEYVSTTGYALKLVEL